MPARRPVDTVTVPSARACPMRCSCGSSVVSPTCWVRQCSCARCRGWGLCPTRCARRRWRWARLAELLDSRARLLAEYGVREQTRTDHLREIAGYLGWRSADEMEWKQLQEFLFSRAMEHDSPRLLFRLACEYLMSVRVVRPGVVNILERVATARDRALAETWTRVEHLVQGEQRRAELDGLLVVVDPYLGRTPLAWLGSGPTQASPAAVKGELEKLAYLMLTRWIWRCCRRSGAGWAAGRRRRRCSAAIRSAGIRSC